jgi:hypothetical protein
MKKILLSLAIVMTLFSCSNENNSNNSDSSSNSNETTIGKLKVTKTTRTITSLNKVKDEVVVKYYYENDLLVLEKYENPIASVAQENSKNHFYYYDGTGKLIKETTSEKGLVSNSFKQTNIYDYSYNSKNQISQVNRKDISSTEKKFVRDLFYDELGRLMKETNSNYVDIFTTTYSYYASSFNLLFPYSKTEFDDKVNISRFLSPTKAYADAVPYSANNVLSLSNGSDVRIFNYDSKKRVTKETRRYNILNNAYTDETIYEYID